MIDQLFNRVGDCDCVIDVRGHRPAAEDDTGSYLLFKPAAVTTSNSDYMTMPGLLKTGSVEAASSPSDTDRSSRLPLSSQSAAFSSCGSDYMEMAARAVHSSKTVSEPGHKKASETSSKKLSTGSRGSDESGNRSVPEVSSKKSSAGSRAGDEYMSMQPPNEEAGYVDVKNVPYRCAGWLQNLSLLRVIFLLLTIVYCTLLQCCNCVIHE